MTDAIPDFTPVTLLTGFLGSGKTTLLNRLLPQPAMGRCAVIINELGASAKIAADRNFDISKRVAKSYKPISQQIDTEKVRIRENFGPYRALEFKRTGYPGLTP